MPTWASAQRILAECKISMGSITKTCHAACGANYNRDEILHHCISIQTLTFEYMLLYKEVPIRSVLDFVSQYVPSLTNKNTIDFIKAMKSKCKEKLLEKKTLTCISLYFTNILVCWRKKITLKIVCVVMVREYDALEPSLKDNHYRCFYHGLIQL